MLIGIQLTGNKTELGQGWQASSLTGWMSISGLLCGLEPIMPKQVGRAGPVGHVDWI